MEQPRSSIPKPVETKFQDSNESSSSSSSSEDVIRDPRFESLCGTLDVDRLQRRKKNAAKDHRYLPYRRPDNTEYEDVQPEEVDQKDLTNE